MIYLGIDPGLSGAIAGVDQAGDISKGEQSALYARILGEPVGKGRPRAAMVGGHARLYTPAATRSWEADAAVALREAWGAHGPLERNVAVRCAVLAVATRPKSRDRKRDPDGRMWRTSKPDSDNVLKAVMDSLQTAGVVTDDKQIVHAEVRSLYTARGEGPCVEVYLWLASETP